MLKRTIALLEHALVVQVTCTLLRGRDRDQGMHLTIPSCV